jgi:hypothetical protein
VPCRQQGEDHGWGAVAIRLSSLQSSISSGRCARHLSAF